MRHEVVRYMRREAPRHSRAAISRTIIYDNDLDGPPILRENPLNRSAEITLAVIDGNNNADERTIHGSYRRALTRNFLRSMDRFNAFSNSRLLVWASEDALALWIRLSRSTSGMIDIAMP